MEGEPFSYDYATEVNASLECAICRAAFVNPAMSPFCQHIFCTLCISRAIELSPTCPIDRSPLQLKDLMEAPRIVKEMVDELKVLCPNEGCGTVCERALLASHMKEHCKVGKADLKGKGKQEVESDERCERCGEVLLADPSTSTHLKCTSTCPHCQLSVVLASLPTHLLSCPLVPVPCPHAARGCTARMPRSVMAEDHLELQCPFEPLKEFWERYDTRIGEVEAENYELKRRCEGLEAGMVEMKESIESLKRGMGSLGDVVPTFDLPPLARRWQLPYDLERPEEQLSHPTPYPGFMPPSEHELPPPPNALVQPQPASPIFPDHTTPGSPPPPPPVTVPSLLRSLHETIAALSSDICALEERQTGAILRSQDDVGGLRAVMHGMRVQMHHLIMDVGRLTGGGGVVGLVGRQRTGPELLSGDSDDEPSGFGYGGGGGPRWMGMGPQPPIIPRMGMPPIVGMGAGGNLGGQGYPYPMGMGMKL